MAKVLIHAADYYNVRQAVGRAFDLFSPGLAGKKVLIKPNVLRAARPEEAVTTHPAVLEAVVERVLADGPAEVVVGDNPGLFGYGANEKCFEHCGLSQASKGRYANIGLNAAEVPFNPDFTGSVSVSRAVLDCDVYISLPKFKTHGLTVLTGAIKNSYGILPGAQKAVLHRLAGNPERFALAVVDVFMLRPPDLIIMDAVLGMQGNGPASTQLRYIGKILAASDALALDATMARMMGLDPSRVGFIREAASRGLGAWREQDIEIEGDPTPIPDFVVPAMGGDAIAHAAHLQSIIDQRTTLRPKADPARCTACGVCVAQCPAEALVIDDGLAQADPAKCIVCFCCQEMCPEKAMSLS